MFDLGFSLNCIYLFITFFPLALIIMYQITALLPT